MTQHKQNPLGDFKPRGGQQVLEELKAVNELVTAKATPEEAEVFRGWLVAGAQAARRRRQGGRLPGLWRRTGERRRAADAGPGPRRARDDLNGPGSGDRVLTRFG
jgi:hypothetical protein